MRLLRKFFRKKAAQEGFDSPAQAEPDRVAADLKAMMEAGLRLATAGPHSEALTSCEAALKHCPDSSELYERAAQAALASGNAELAKDYFALALHYDSQSAMAAMGLASALEALGQSEGGRKTLRDFLDV